jgi:peptide/nickel transport system ATP-binding protein
MNDSCPLIELKNVKKFFPMKQGNLRAVDDVSFSICSGKTLGLVGESGCGKSTIGKSLLMLHSLTSGQIFYKGALLENFNKKEIKSFRKEVQMIFQDPFSSLSPRMTTEEILKEPLQIHKIFSSSKDLKNRVYELLELVGLEKNYAGHFPHEFSGGQRQRIGIARALALNPHFIVCDEPIAALDVSIQAQIVNLLKSLQKQMGLTYLFISHDLAMVKYLCTEVAVMYLGHLVEIGPSCKVYKSPLHPYTQALLSAIPIPDPAIEKKRIKIVLPGEIPSPITPPSGCVFCTRCPKAINRCFKEKPLLKKMDNDHFVACHLADSGASCTD